MYKILGKGKPIRLFVGGLHGNEWIDTSDILDKLQAPKVGSLAIIPVVSHDKYVSTLDHSYYSTLGISIVQAIKKLSPQIYVEFHSYSRKNKHALTGSDRIYKIGVPPYSELNHDVLLGSVSPLIRKKLFNAADLCLSFEIQKENNVSKKYGERLATKMKECLSKDDFITKIAYKYPLQSKKVIEDYKKFYSL